jgi:hypothetical protein
VDSGEYLRAIDSQVVECANHLCHRGWFFVRGEAPCHTSNETIAKLILSGQNSAGMTREITGSGPDRDDMGDNRAKNCQGALLRKETLWNAVEQAWNELDQEMIDQLVAAFSDAVS